MRTYVLSLATLVVAASLHAVQTQRIAVESADSWRKGRMMGASLSEEGGIQPGGLFTNIAAFTNLGVETVWSAAATPDGGAIIGTGPGGRVLRVSADGKVSELAKLPEPQVMAVAVAPDGAFFAASSPTGKVWRVTADGKTEAWFDTREKYVWALQCDGTNLYAATGSAGRLFRITGKDQGNVVFDSDETNLRSLALDGARGVLFGTDEHAVLYRLQPDGKVQALFDANAREVRAIAVSPEGAIAFSVLGTEAATKAKSPAPSAKPAAKADRDDAPGSPDSAPSAAGGKGSVYVLEQPGLARTVWTGTEDEPHAIAWFRDGWWVGTAPLGRVHAVGSNDVRRVAAQTADNTVVALLGIGGVLHAVTADQPGWHRLVPGAGPGYESQVFDAGAFTRWGRLALEGDFTGLVETRTGNTAEPGPGWSEWRSLYKSGAVQGDASRYLQFRATLESGQLRRAELFHTPHNAAPRIHRIQVTAGMGYVPAGPMPPQPPAPKTATQLHTATAERTAAEEPKFNPVARRSYRTIAWDASDPNGDTLQFRILVRRPGDPSFRELKKEQEERVYSLDTAGWPEGRYYFRVEATDAPSNATPLSHALESVGVLVDNTAPEIGAIQVAGGIAEFDVTDTASPVVSVEVSRDGIEFAPVLPVDGVLDSKVERFQVKLAAGETLYVRSRDDAGNDAPGRSSGSP
jgi:sugar lactone lactonase YvrE